MVFNFTQDKLDLVIDFFILYYGLIIKLFKKTVELSVLFFVFIKMYLIVGEFSKRLKNTKGYAKSTVDNYCRTLRFLDDFIRSRSWGERGVWYPHTIELEDIEDFNDAYIEKGGSVRTANNYLSWIKMFLKFCRHKGLKVLDWERIMFAREPEHKIHALTWDSTKLFLNQLKNDPNKSEILRIRDYAIGLVLVYGGLRVQELIDLKVADLGENMQIIGKGGVRRLICLRPEHLKVIEYYLFLRKKRGIKSEYVFASHSNNSLGGDLSRAAVEEVIRKAWKKIWVEVRPHKLRHTCATQMLEHGGDITFISQILGHKNVRTTQTYLDYSNSKLRDTQNLIPIM